ncbi:MAG: glutamate-1-semialdehyde 2,1-aminomutase [Nitrospinaceae bacterium]|nr:glutamate-1-semialdehyde 2,1-aminomutase [Nitrospinaceae bacterium]NIR56256.1 glutamate-1-semialdehyde 2,1-aminomutase [Nitrospinaceae bacterium]NIS86712.1 glutamate-1-semialdehyde 2,1-aminomutase [Nitrospinaceae bacterium]NIT83545.1 glutamate-1-semialdehyde 2,1-aminomutase [Nitrospinaceae bacterium]NIU45750.1 glutamate-1-semialdehyde 2,1-aminomutase [Nitrospinaceae bacterium]
MKRTQSESLFDQARQSIPGGVNSPVRAFKAVGGHPLFIVKGSGSKIVDVDGNEFIDYVSSWGPLIFGHAHPQIVEAIRRQAALGTSFGAPTELETTLAEKVVASVPSIESVRLVSSGTEAGLSALRLARGFTGRDKIVKFEGCYHGHADSLLVKAGSGVLSLGLPDCPGIVGDLAKNTLTLPYNDAPAVEELFGKMGKEIACLIVEPVAGNMGVVPPQPGFLELLRKVTSENGALLIFDEVITGFRVSLGGAQQRFGVTPDLTCLGKIIGGGLPVGAFGGKKEIMDHMAPVGSVYQAGTLSGNPLAVTAGIEMLNLLSQPGVYEDLEEKSDRLCNGFKENVKQWGVKAAFTRVGSMFSMFFTDREIVNFESVQSSDLDLFKRYFNAMLEEGIYIAPSQFEAGFMSAVHTDDDIQQTIEAQSRALQKALG